MWAKKESALVLLAPEAEDLVREFRERFDPSAAQGVPAHITVLYPFLPPGKIGADALARLQTLFGGCAPFDYTLAEIARFPDLLYLTPRPAAPFKSLLSTVAEQYPETPPYGGVFDEVVPHLTVAQVADPRQLAAIAVDFNQAAAGRLPIAARAEQAVLMDNRAGPWEVSAVFALGG